LIVEAEGQAALPSSAATNKNNNNTAANALHPFDAALLDLTVAGGARGYAACLKRVDSLRKSLQQTGKQLAGRASSAANAAAARQLLEEGTAELERLFSRNAGCVRDLANAARRLRRLPQVDPTLPTVALVGAPNVGKSSLVRRLSSGAPTVCDYPFTTRSVALGHFYAPRLSALEEGNDDDEEEQEKRQKQQSLRRHQVTDTPGLLDRDDPERNAMERLTLACVAHLPEAAVLFVVDLTEGCGQSVAAQWRVRTRLRRAFPDRAWVDVVSKADLLEPWVGEEEREEGGGEKSSGESVAALMAAAAEAELAVERAEAPIGQRGGALEYERAVRLAAAVREARAGAVAGGGGGDDDGEEQQQQQQGGLLAPPLAVVRVSTMDDDDASLDGLKHAVLRAIAWAEKQEQRRRAAEVV
jgi:nucleolar GTP-binding protein